MLSYTCHSFILWARHEYFLAGVNPDLERHNLLNSNKTEADWIQSKLDDVHGVEQKPESKECADSDLCDKWGLCKKEKVGLNFLQCWCSFILDCCWKFIYYNVWALYHLTALAMTVALCLGYQGLRNWLKNMLQFWFHSFYPNANHNRNDNS